MYNQPQSAVPPDKIIQQMIIQAIQAFYIQDYDTGIYFLNQIRTNLPRYMYQISPAYKTLCKEIVKLLQDGSLVPDRATATDQEAAATSHPGLSGISSGYTPESHAQEEDGLDPEPSFSETPAETEPSTFTVAPTESQQVSAPTFEEESVEEEAPRGAIPTEFISELSSAVDSVRDKKKKKVSGDLTGSMDELDEFDF